ncbi:hypothetical protein Y032_0007g3570 [Ancylostoma ceylanicum]|uniref:Uncharacterized protein n=1 Tax=Ancylostoma ceylanicum TaxID=53326 RepID=A0A016VPX8_9BILA|nr:hypothetical protein Y032_0007g3570 [Ancylostoma ceylanicum]
MEEDSLCRLDSENLISFLEDYDRERVLIMADTGAKDFEQFEANFCQAIRGQRVSAVTSLFSPFAGVDFALLEADADEYELILEELNLTKNDLPALCYMNSGEDLNVCRLTDNSVEYFEKVLSELLDSYSLSTSDEEELLAAIATAIENDVDLL